MDDLVFPLSCVFETCASANIYARTNQNLIRREHLDEERNCVLLCLSTPISFEIEKILTLHTKNLLKWKRHIDKDGGQKKHILTSHVKHIVLMITSFQRFGSYEREKKQKKENKSLTKRLLLDQNTNTFLISKSHIY